MGRRPGDELDILQRSSAAAIEAATRRLAMAALQGNDRGLELAEIELAEILGKVQAVADLLGRRRILLEIRQATGVRFAEQDQTVPFLPNPWNLPFEDAVDAILKREPLAADGWREARDAWEAGAFVTARASGRQINKRIQSIVAKAVHDGTDQAAAELWIMEALRDGVSKREGDGLGYTRAYAETIFRTSIASAYAEGRRAMVMDPDNNDAARAVRRAVIAWRFVTARDVAVRDNHRAAENLIAHFDDPIWDELSPPLGYQCRCSLELVPTAEAERRGVVNDDGAHRPQSIPSGAKPDDEFRRRHRR